MRTPVGNFVNYVANETNPDADNKLRMRMVSKDDLPSRVHMQEDVLFKKSTNGACYTTNVCVQVDHHP